MIQTTIPSPYVPSRIFQSGNLITDSRPGIDGFYLLDDRLPKMFRTPVRTKKHTKLQNSDFRNFTISASLAFLAFHLIRLKQHVFRSFPFFQTKLYNNKSKTFLITHSITAFLCFLRSVSFFQSLIFVGKKFHRYRRFVRLFSLPKFIQFPLFLFLGLFITILLL